MLDLAVDYVVKEKGEPWRTRIYVGDEKVAETRALKDSTYILTAKNGDAWTLNARVHGEISPFSMTVVQSKARETPGDSPGTTVLTIQNHLFLHKGKFYMLGCAPEGRPPREFLLGKIFICRLDTFPFSDLSEIDHETRSRLKRLRGTPVGELEGLGREGHNVHLPDELEDIGLPLAASCYLLCSTA